MTKIELVKAIDAKRKKEGKETSGEMLDLVMNTIKENLIAGEEITFVGFGAFKQVDRAERKVKVPTTGKIVTVNAYTVPKFKLSKKFADNFKK